MYKIFTEKEKKFLLKHGTMPRKELTLLFNKKFNQSRKTEQIRSFLFRHGIQSVNGNGRFKKGSTVQPTREQRGWNKETTFKKGNITWNTKLIGSERVDKRDGVVSVKIGYPNQWRFKHHIIWEQHNGKTIPENHLIVFKDGNTTNLSPENLDCVSRSVNCVFNSCHTGLNKFRDYETKRVLAELIIEVNK